MPQATSLEDLMRIRAANRGFLDSINGHLGTALGFKRETGANAPSDTPAVIVFVPQKINPRWLPGDQLLPKQLDGPEGLTCPLDVVEGSKAEDEDPVARATGELSEQLRGWDDRISVGSQVAHWIDSQAGEYSMGTLGAFARDADDHLGFLTNQHVAIEPGQQIFHPVPWGTKVGTTADAITWVRDQNWYGPHIDEPDTYVRVDCAFVRLVDAEALPRNDLNPEMKEADDDGNVIGQHELGPVLDITLNDMFPIGQRVRRIGRTTGQRRGTIVAFGYEHRDQADVTVYSDLLIIGDNGVSFSTHGDSGSLIVTDDASLNPIGLLWGGWQEKLRLGRDQENWTYGIALSRVLTALGITLVRKADEL